jgi:hypothetical protein
MRGRGTVLVLAIVAGLLSACHDIHRPAPSACPSASPAGVVARGEEPVPTTPPVDEALWVADGTGTVRAIDARTSRTTAKVDLGGPTDLVPALVSGGGLVWAYRYDSGILRLIDPAAARVVAHTTVPPVHPLIHNEFRYAHGALWIAQPGKLWRITPTGTATATVLPPDFAPGTVAATARWLWLADGNRLVRVDPADPGAIQETTAPDEVRQLLGTPTDLYASGMNTSAVEILDADTGVLKQSFQLPAGDDATALIDTGEEVWVTSGCGDVVRIPDGAPTRIADVSQDLPAVAGLGSLWVGDEVRSQVVRVSLGSGRVIARIPFVAADPGDPAFRMVAGRASVWILDSNFADGVSRLDPDTDRITRLTRAGQATPGLSAVVSRAPTG